MSHTGKGKPKSWSRVLGHQSLPILPFIICLVLWWGLSLFNIPEFIMPSPGKVWSELLNPKWRWFSQSWATFQEVMGGFASAVIIGTFLGLLVTWNDTLRRMLMPILVF